jgi:CotH kinase protein
VGGGAGGGGAAGSTGGSGSGGVGGTGGSVPPGPLDTQTGCAGVFNPDQILNLQLGVAPGDWASLVADTSYTLMVQARLRCNGGPEQLVGIRRKRSGGQQKVGLKIDLNEFVPGQSFFGLRKLSLENGVSSGTTSDSGDVRGLLAEYLGWRLMVRSGAVSGRAALVTVTVNGSSLGVYVNVEQVDKTFLESRLGDDSGWLYKRSGSEGDGFKTHETDGLNDPYDDYFCFFAKGSTACAMPATDVMARELPQHLNIPQLLRMGAVNALIANTDAPLFKDNNYYWYDWAGGRLYLPWDLDTTMNALDMNVFTGGVGGQVGFYTQAVFSNWEGQYRGILGELLSGTLAQPVIDAEIDRAGRVAGAALDADPHAGGSAAPAVADLKAWWRARLAAVARQVAGP